MQSAYTIYSEDLTCGNCKRYRSPVCELAAFIFATSIWPISQLGGEFILQINKGDLLYMPSALPGISTAKAASLLQLSDRLIKTVPEVDSVFGKAGRADTATDPAPLEMFETTIRFKPKDQWRPGMTQDRLIEELDRAVKVPGLANFWIPPIRNRIDMLSTGIKRGPLSIDGSTRPPNVALISTDCLRTTANESDRSSRFSSENR